MEELEKYLEWNLIDYNEYSKRNNEVRCKCGRALKRAYTVVHVTTGEVMILGSTHFVQYTSISEEDAREIINNFKKIDLEKVEILEKVIENRDMDIASKVNEEFKFPKDMEKQVEVNLPLLDRQIIRLEKLGVFTNCEDEISKEKSYTLNALKHTLNNSNLTLFPSKPSYNINREKMSTKQDNDISISEMLINIELQLFTVDDTEKYIPK